MGPTTLLQSWNLTWATAALASPLAAPLAIFLGFPNRFATQATVARGLTFIRVGRQPHKLNP